MAQPFVVEPFVAGPSVEEPFVEAALLIEAAFVAVMPTEAATGAAGGGTEEPLRPALLSVRQPQARTTIIAHGADIIRIRPANWPHNKALVAQSFCASYGVS